MIKKLLALCGLLAGANVFAQGPVPYVGAGLGVQVNTASAGGNYRGVPFNVFAGYGGIVNQNFYLAGELNGTLATADMRNNGDLKTSYSYGASIIPGLMLSDHTMFFGRIGALRSHFASSTTISGGQVGVGLQTLLTQNIDIRGEYDYTSYNTFSRRGNRYGSPRSDAFNLGIVYKFD